MSTFPPLRDIKSKFEADLSVYGLRRKIQNLETPPVKIGYGYFTANLERLRSTKCDLLSTNDVINIQKKKSLAAMAQLFRLIVRRRLLYLQKSVPYKT